MATSTSTGLSSRERANALEITVSMSASEDSRRNDAPVACATPATSSGPSTVQVLRLYGISCACAICASSPSLKTKTTTPRPSADAVASSIAVIRNAPSPTMPTTCAWGRASFEPIVAGTQYPMQLKSVGEISPRAWWIGSSSAARNV